MKQYRFFYHFNKHKNMMSVHWQKQCLIVKNVECNVPCRTKWSDKQPKIVMCGKASNVIIENDIARII